MSQGFLELRNRYILEGKLDLLESVHIGSGSASFGSDAAFIKDAKGGFLPGSSLRGVLRTAVERILQSVGGNRGCVLFVDQSHPSCLTCAPEPAKENARKLPGKDLRELLWIKGGQCDVCRLFGSPWAASKLRVEDGRLIGPDAHYAVRDGVGIDRDTESAKEQIKYDFEVLEPGAGGASFGFRLELENADRSDFALLGILLGELKDGRLSVGGKKARGMGRVKLQSNFTVQYLDKERGYPLLEYLKTGRLKGESALDFHNKVTKPALDAYFARGGRA
jgi:CRISPR-associated RAMP protein (TIGR02581 family)